jgi:hypothetical protein
MRALAFGLLLFSLGFNILEAQTNTTSEGETSTPLSAIDKQFEALWQVYKTNNAQVVFHEQQAGILSSQIEAWNKRIRTYEDIQNRRAKLGETPILNSPIVVNMRDKQKVLQYELSMVQVKIEVIRLDLKKKLMPTLQEEGQ